MKKADITVILTIIALLIAWSWIDRAFIKPRFPDAPPPAAVEPAAPGSVANAATAGAPAVTPAFLNPASTNAVAVAAPQEPEQTLVLTNRLVSVTLSNRGASLTSVRFQRYKVTQSPDSANIEFDFRDTPALAVEGIAGLGRTASFTVVSSSPTNVVYRQSNPQGITLERRLSLDPDGYLVRGEDVLVNKSPAEFPLPEYGWQLGRMVRQDAADETYPTTGVDAFHSDGAKHYARNIWKLLDKSSSSNAVFAVDKPFSWISVKNRFFCQLLTLVQGDQGLAEGARVKAESDKLDGKHVTTRSVSAVVRLPGFSLIPGVEYKRAYSLYLGPSSTASLATLGGGQERTIDYQLWSVFNFVIPLCGWLASGLKGLHAVFPNYGVAIILLTFIVRMAVWPLTHKSSVSMRKMQALQPQMNAINEKHRDNPQRKQQAMMALFKENKVNPAAGCLPILVQIPVFIGLYGTMRTAIELRFAHFLWIDDLSLSEGLLRGSIPLLGELNVLPLLMGLSMFFQQKMTPSTMDEMQRKIMNVMPLFLIFMCYKMPAGLLLYWTTSNVISIAQLVINVKWLKMHPITPAGAPASAVGAGNRPAPKGGKR